MCSLLRRPEWKPRPECSLTPSWQALWVSGKIGKSLSPRGGEVGLPHLPSTPPTHTHTPSGPLQTKASPCTSWCRSSGVLTRAAWAAGGRSPLCWNLAELGLNGVWGAAKTATFRLASSEHEPVQLFPASSLGQHCPAHPRWEWGTGRRDGDSGL